MNQPTDHSTNRPTNYRAANPKVEQTYLTTFNTGDYDPPCLAYFIVREGGREDGSLLGVSNQLKFGYV